MNKFPSSKSIWNWLVTSSKDPDAVALTVKGSLITFVGVALKILPLLHVPVSADFNNLPDIAYSLVDAVLVLIGTIATTWGFIRKVWVFFSASHIPGPGDSQIPPATGGAA